MDQVEDEEENKREEPSEPDTDVIRILKDHSLVGAFWDTPAYPIQLRLATALSVIAAQALTLGACFTYAHLEQEEIEFESELEDATAKLVIIAIFALVVGAAVVSFVTWLRKRDTGTATVVGLCI